MDKAHELELALAAIVGPERVLHRPVDRIAFAADASFYRLIPKAVVFAQGTEEVRALFRLSRQLRVPMTFRAAGTSLSGQAITDGILVEVARHWRGIKVLEGGAADPGPARGHRRPRQPRPAALPRQDGPRSGLHQHLHRGRHPLQQLQRHVLRSGPERLPHPGIADVRAALGQRHRHRRSGRGRCASGRRSPAWPKGLLELKAELEANPALAARIRAKYRMKNTTGYSLNAFLDFERPVDIFRNLLVGSEGTLAFIAEAVLRPCPTCR